MSEISDGFVKMKAKITKALDQRDNLIARQRTLIDQQEKEIKRLQAIEQALIDFHADMLPSKTYTAEDVYGWIHSTTGYKGME
jgi:hypothetical protein